MTTGGGEKGWTVTSARRPVDVKKLVKARKLEDVVDVVVDVDQSQPAAAVWSSTNGDEGSWDDSEYPSSFYLCLFRQVQHDKPGM